MDPAGARALAQRLADGKAPGEMTLEEALAAEARSAERPAETPAEEPATAEVGDGVIYIRPARRSASNEVWMYVRASDGRLHRGR